jgi:hypothetical protein
MNLKKISEIERKLILTKNWSDIWWEEHKRCLKIKRKTERQKERKTEPQKDKIRSWQEVRNTFGYFK